MAVQVQGDRNLIVFQDGLNDLGVLPLLLQRGCRGMPEVTDAEVGEFCSLEHPVKRPGEVPGVDGLSIGLTEGLLYSCRQMSIHSPTVIFSGLTNAPRDKSLKALASLSATS